MQEPNTSVTTPEVENGTEETEIVESQDTETKPEGNGQPPVEAGNVEPKQTKKDKKAKKQPAWKESQQKNTEAKNNDDRAEEAQSSNTDRVSIKMRTDYRDVAKAGHVWETDREKAAELVRLGRADYVDAE